jgi:hypothetical protein
METLLDGDKEQIFGLLGAQTLNAALRKRLTAEIETDQGKRRNIGQNINIDKVNKANSSQYRKLKAAHQTALDIAYDGEHNTTGSERRAIKRAKQALDSFKPIAPKEFPVADNESIARSKQQQTRTRTARAGGSSTILSGG